MTDVTISIINHDNTSMLVRCLATLPAACGSLSWNVTVVDNLPAVCNEPVIYRACVRCRIISNPVPRGFGENHNSVLRGVVGSERSRYVLVLNDDTELAGSSIERLVARMDRHPKLGAVGPRLIDSGGEELASRLAYPTVLAAMSYDLFGKTDPPDQEGWLQGSCLLLRVTALKQIGLFDEQFFLFYEDVDLSRRLTDAGWALSTESMATVTHHGHATILREAMSPFPWQQGMRSRYLFFRKYSGVVVATFLADFSRLCSLAASAVGVAKYLRSRRPTNRRVCTLRWRMALYNPRHPPRRDSESGREGTDLERVVSEASIDGPSA